MADYCGQGSRVGNMLRDLLSALTAAQRENDGLQAACRQWKEQFDAKDAALQQARASLTASDKDAARYRWLRDNNAYAPEENCIDGGKDLDELCDRGIAIDAEHGHVNPSQEKANG